MSESRASLARCYRGWDTYQQYLVAAVAPLSPEQLTLRGAPHLRSIGEQAAHIVAVRARWLSLDLHEGGTELAALMSWDGWTAESGVIVPPPRAASELVRGLATTWGVMHAALQRWTVADLDDVFPPTYPGEESFTRQFVLWHLIEHDVHHGGELSFVLGMHGLPGLDI